MFDSSYSKYHWMFFMLDCSITSNCSYLVREQLKELTKQYDKSEDDLKALQSVGQVRDWPWIISNCRTSSKFVFWGQRNVFGLMFPWMKWIFYKWNATVSRFRRWDYHSWLRNPCFEDLMSRCRVGIPLDPTEIGSSVPDCSDVV